MIMRDTQIVLPAGWVHLAFSIIEATLLLAFVFICKPQKPFTIIATILALMYFMAAGVSGYIIHHGFMVTDVIIVSGWILLVVLYPHFIKGRSVGAAGKQC
jgi:hypothetical protein